MFDLWDVFQHYQIKNARKEAREASRELREEQRDERDTHTRELQRLEAKIDGLALVTQALAELLQAQGIGSQAVADKVREIDLRDGALDGRVSHQAVNCSGCGRTVHPRQAACMYCGTPAIR